MIAAWLFGALVAGFTFGIIIERNMMLNALAKRAHAGFRMMNVPQKVNEEPKDATAMHRC